MNERIKELFIELFGKNNFPKGNAEVYMSADDLEQFAELIVKECANVLKENWTMAGSAPTISAIKEHFGVE